MSAAIALREDFGASDLRRLAKSSKDAAQSRRLLALAAIYDGGSRLDAARIGSVDRQVIRDWVLRFNADGAAGLIDRKAPGKPPKLNDSQRQALAAKLESGPEPDIDGVVRWRLVDLKHWIWREFAISLDERNVGRTLKAMDFVKLTARPRHHGQEDGAVEGFKKTSPPRWRKSALNSQPTVIWNSGGKMRPGSGKRPRLVPGPDPGITRRWARKGSRPRAPKDQRTTSAYIFGAICPARGVGAALVLPRCDTQAMQWHLDEISSQVTPGAHAILMVDQARWHTTDELVMPANITLLLLPPRCPELNPVENIWQFMRDNWLSDRIFTSYDEIVAICAEAWNKLSDQPARITSIGSRKWAYGF